MDQQSPARIVDYDRRYGDAFKRLNCECAQRWPVSRRWAASRCFSSRTAACCRRWLCTNQRDSATNRVKARQITNERTFT